MTRNDLAVRFAEQMGMDPEQAVPYVETFMNIILDNLGKGERIEIRDFGVFQILERKSRVARNPRTGIKVHVDTKRTVKFKTGKALLERVREAGFQETGQRAAKAIIKNSDD